MTSDTSLQSRTESELFATLSSLRSQPVGALAEEVIFADANSFHLPPAIVASDSQEHELQVFWAFETGRQLAFERCGFVCVRNALVINEGIIFLDSGLCLKESIYPHTPDDLSTRFPRSSQYLGHVEAQAQLRLTALSIDEAVHLREPGETGYFHWINSVLPRAAALDRLTALNRLPLLVDASKRFAAESLAALQIDPDRALPLPNHYVAKRLWVATPTNVCGDHFTRPPFWTQEIRRRFGITAHQHSRRRLYLTRADAPIRRIAAEVELRSFLESLGFESLTIGDMRHSDQVDLFRSTEVLVSAHGAGLSNAIFMERGIVIEIVPRTRLWPTFRTLAARSGLSYAAFISGVVEEDGETSSGNEDIALDMSRFQPFLIDAIKGFRS